MSFLSVHLKQEEKLSIRCGRDGGVESLEVLGMIMLRVKAEEFGRIVVAVENKESRNIQLQVNEKITFFSSSFHSNRFVVVVLFQTHPNIDKKLFTNDSFIGLKNPERPFPANQEVGVIKWRYTSTDSKEIPLTSKTRRWRKRGSLFLTKFPFL